MQFVSLACTSYTTRSFMNRRLSPNAVSQLLYPALPAANADARAYLSTGLGRGTKDGNFQCTISAGFCVSGGFNQEDIFLIMAS